VATQQELSLFVQILLSRSAQVLNLDDVADVIGAADVSSDEIGSVLDALEAAGRSISTLERPHITSSLQRVLLMARELRQELGRIPRVQEIAHRSGLEPEAIQLALLYAAVLQR
jgi:hypothetical protein